MLNKMVAIIALKIYRCPYLKKKNTLLGRAVSFIRHCDLMQIFQRAVTCKNCFSCESKAYNLFKAKISPFIVK